MIHSAVGCWVTLQCRILRRSCSVDEEAIQHSECHCRHGEEIEGSDYLTMILEKGEPLLLGVTTANNATQISGHGPFGDRKAKLLQFRVDFGSAPVSILLGQPSDQIPQFLGDPGSATTWPRPPAPVELKASAVPCDHGVWFDNKQSIGPARPQAAEGGPKQPVDRVQGWPRSLAFEHGELLPQSEDFQGGIASGTEENAESTPHSD